MKATAPKTNIPSVDAAMAVVQKMLANISSDNFKGALVSGTTHSTADTQQQFRHGLSGTPSGYLPIEGNVYVASNGYGTSTVDVRSHQASQAFKIFVYL